MQTRRDFLRLAGLGATSATLFPRLGKSAAPVFQALENRASRRLNLLFIMTDEQRWDALSYSGNKFIATPNLDRLAREGTYFENMYSSCPVCCPARAVILTGKSIETVGIRSNEDFYWTTHAGQDVPTFDNLLTRAGYYTEYWGKWHVPYKYAATYDNKVRPTTSAGVADQNIESHPDSIKAWLDKRGIRKNVAGPGEELDEFGRPYRPIKLDLDFVPVQTKKGKQSKGQGDQYGCLLTPADATTTAMTASETLAALEHVHKTGRPFSITCSMEPPHPPVLVPEPFYSQFPAANLPVPDSLNDPMSDAPAHYRARALEPQQQRLYRNPQNIREMKQIYYGMVADTDLWVGRLLNRLEELGMAQNTLVVFTSDHGEMLGDHGLIAKFVFYEGSVHIPLILWRPGVIPAGRRVATPVSQCDIFPTILDYLGLPPAPSDGRSLRNLVEGRPDPLDFTISEWHSGPGVPTVMIRDARYKLITTHHPSAQGCDALYDLVTDPAEMHNLIGPHAANRPAALIIAEGLKAKLVGWYEKIHSPRLAGLKQHQFQ